jgi:hypothetical protein
MEMVSFPETIVTFMCAQGSPSAWSNSNFCLPPKLGWVAVQVLLQNITIKQN